MKKKCCCHGRLNNNTYNHRLQNFDCRISKKIAPTWHPKFAASSSCLSNLLCFFPPEFVQTARSQRNTLAVACEVLEEIRTWRFERDGIGIPGCGCSHVMTVMTDDVRTYCLQKLAKITGVVFLLQNPLKTVHLWPSSSSITTKKCLMKWGQIKNDTANLTSNQKISNYALSHDRSVTTLQKLILVKPMTIYFLINRSSINPRMPSKLRITHQRIQELHHMRIRRFPCPRWVPIEWVKPSLSCLFLLFWSWKLQLLMAYSNGIYLGISGFTVYPSKQKVCWWVDKD